MENKALNIARRYMQGNDPSHDIAHVKRVILNAKKIYAASNNKDVDLDTLIAIAALHDCIDHKYVKPEDMIAKRALLHCEMVSELNISAADAEFIISTIENISYSAEVKGGVASTSTCPYLAIARDADRLESIGAIGIARCFAYSAATGRLLVTEDFDAETRAKNGSTDFKGDESAIMHFYEKLVKLQDRFKTDAGKALALQRHEFLLKFLDQVHYELGM